MDTLEDTVVQKLPDGEHVFENDSIKTIITYKNGVKNGPMMVYENGLLLVKMMYQDDVPHGSSMHYYSNGATHMVIPFEKGIAHGLITHYYPNGSVLLTAQMIDGKKQGLQSIFDEDGHLQQETHFVDGLMHGPLTTYHEGKMIARTFYEQGVPVMRSKKTNAA